MADDRPTPRYGELAPEGWAWSPPAEPDAAADQPRASGGDKKPDDAPRPFLLADSVASVFLLLFAVTSSTSVVPGLFGLRRVIDRFYRDRGLGSYGGGSAVDIAGAIAGSAHIVLLIGAIWLTVRLIGQRRRSWPVPLLIGALATIITFTCVLMALVADPGLISSLSAG
ncbi:DUF6264 family protein [Agreia sp. COWG]|uniref:DUF6264 family protein n=1 Tax=Agreia sp. COWG TaxID=2773266 RepID=UPI001927FB27|nr:DUF6264 family protein [Agreia sp. COWG]CAD6002026.1 conserved membrane protein of unknown function [Agreia sp. COWG]